MHSTASRVGVEVHRAPAMPSGLDAPRTWAFEAGAGCFNPVLAVSGLPDPSPVLPTSIQCGLRGRRCVAPASLRPWSSPQSAQESVAPPPTSGSRSPSQPRAVEKCSSIKSVQLQATQSEGLATSPCVHDERLRPAPAVNLPVQSAEEACWRFSLSTPRVLLRQLGRDPTEVAPIGTDLSPAYAFKLIYPGRFLEKPFGTLPPFTSLCLSLLLSAYAS